jgi:hypothetical protein
MTTTAETTETSERITMLTLGPCLDCTHEPWVRPRFLATAKVVDGGGGRREFDSEVGAYEFGGPSKIRTAIFHDASRVESHQRYARVKEIRRMTRMIFAAVRDVMGTGMEPAAAVAKLEQAHVRAHQAAR